MEAKINDSIRQLIIKNLDKLIGDTRHLWLLLSYRDDIDLTSVVNIRDSIISIGTAIEYQTKIDLENNVYRALKAVDAPDVETYVIESFPGGTSMYVADTPGLDNPNVSTDNMWNALLIKAPLAQNDPLNPTYYNVVTLVIAEESSNKANLTQPACIVMQTFLANKTTLPRNEDEYLKILMQL